MVLGHALGTVVPTVATVPVVATGFYALLVTGNIVGQEMAAVSPFLWMEPSLGQHESFPLAVLRIALFLTVTVAGAARAMTRPRVRRSLPDVAICLAVPAVLVIFSLVRRVNPVIVRFGTKPDNLDEVWDQALTYDPPIDTERIDAVWLRPDGTMDPDAAVTAAGLYACDWENGSTDLKESNLKVAWEINDYLETGTLRGSLASMSVAEVQTWLATHQKQLHDCTLTAEQLPGAR